mgnify:CR=1 FL=1
MRTRVVNWHNHDYFWQIGLLLGLLLLLGEGNCLIAGTCLCSVTSNKVSNVYRVENLLAIVREVDTLPILEKSIHISQAGFLLGTRILLALTLLFAFFRLYLIQSEDWRVVNILHFVDRDDGQNWLIETD